MTRLPLAPAYRDAVKLALGMQIPLTFLFLILLDRGMLAKTGGCAMVGFWVGVAIIMVRRPLAPRPDDLTFVRWGYLPLVGIGMVLTGTIGGALGGAIGI